MEKLRSVLTAEDVTITEQVKDLLDKGRIGQRLINEDAEARTVVPQPNHNRVAVIRHQLLPDGPHVVWDYIELPLPRIN